MKNKIKELFPPIEVSKNNKKVASIHCLVYLPIMIGYSYLAGTGLGVLIKRAVRK